ncbi:MAG TPA: DNRLRE domain-containing protein, partial [Polyangiaceae bacterium]
MTSVSFQDGALPTAAYAGTTDTTLHQAAPTTNFGNDTTCLVDGDDGAGADLSSLLSWNVSSIPIGSTVTAASVTLTIVNPTGNTYNLFALKRTWNELQSTWNNATSSTAWATPGAFGATDRDATILGSVTGPNGTLTIPLNAAGVSAIQSWVNGSNFGLVISDSAGTDGIDFASSENATIASRPKLNVTYDPPTSGTLSFQDGVQPTAAYAGTTDTTLHQAAPTTNFGNDSTVLVDGDDGAGADLSSLLRWDVSQIPAGSAVTSASVTLSIVNPTGNTYNLFSLARPWNELEATWNNATSSTAWATPGAFAASDRNATILGSVTGPIGSVTIPLNAAGVSAVQAWVNGSNNGLVISDSAGTDGIDFASSENATLASRPKLTVTWGSGGGGGPAPTTTTNYSEQSGDVLNPERGW